MGRRLFWVILVMNLFCFSPFCFAQTVYTSQYTYISQPYPKVLITLTPTDYPSPALQQDPFLLENAFQSFITQNFPPVSPSGPPFTREIFLNYFTGMSNNIAYSTDYGVNTFWTIPNEATLSTPMTWTLKQYRPGYDYTTNTPTSVFEEYASFSFTVVLVKTSKGIYAQISDSLGNSSFVPSPAEFEVSGVELKAGAADNAAERYGQWYETGTIQVGSSESQQEKSYELRELVMKPVIEQVDAQGNQSNTTIFSPQLGQKLEFTPSFVGLGINPWTPTPVQWELDILDSSGEVIFADVGSGISPIAWDGTMNTVAPASSGSGPLVASAGTYTYEMYGYTAEGTFAAAGGTVQVGQEQIKVDLSPKIIHPRNLIYLHENGISGNLTVTSVPTQYGVVFVSVNNLPVGQPLTVFLKAEAVRDSGGHFYDTDRPNGSFVSPQSSHTFLGSTIPFTIVGENNPSACQGKVAVGNCFTIAYRPPQVGGKVKISVTASGATVENKPEFHVQVPGSLGNTSSFLLQFANLPFDNLEKDSFLLQTYSQYFVIRGDGPTSSYTNPLFQCTVTNGHRYVGHYAIFEMLSDLARAAQKFYERTGGIPLQIGDLSLPDGGVFDLCSNWIPPHSFHRIGNSVSIDIQGLTEEEIKILRSKMWRYHFLENTGFHNEGVLEYEWFPSQSPEIALLP